MNANASTPAGSSPTPSSPLQPTVSAATYEGRVIIACAVSSVAMVCLVAAMLYFRVTVLRRERVLREMERMRALARKGENSRALSRTPSRQSLSLSRSWPSGSFRRQFSHPPLSPASELRRGSLLTIPNGFGVQATVEPSPGPTTTTTAATTPERRASSLPDTALDKDGVARRASWSFENPVFDQWVPPLTKLDDDEEVFTKDKTASDSNDNNFMLIDSELSGDGVALVAMGMEDDSVSSAKDGGPRKFQKVSRLCGFSGSPLYIRNEDHPSMPTLHEREDSSSSGGNEKATERETTAAVGPVVNLRLNDDEPTDLPRRRSESSC